MLQACSSQDVSHGNRRVPEPHEVSYLRGLEAPLTGQGTLKEPLGLTESHSYIIDLRVHARESGVMQCAASRNLSFYALMC